MACICSVEGACVMPWTLMVTLTVLPPVNDQVAVTVCGGHLGRVHIPS